MKKCFLMLLCLLTLMGSARGAVCVRMEDAAALLEADGSEIVPPGVYDDIVPLGGGLFAGELDGAYALVDEAGRQLTDAVYSELRMQEGLILARMDGMWGLLHEDGRPRTAFIYSLIVPSLSENCWALKGDPNDVESDRLYRIDVEGRLRGTRINVRAMSHTAGEGMLSVLLPASGKYGYCNSQGEMVIDAQYDYAGDFENGLAVVVLDGRYGVIDRKGAYVIPAGYDFLEISEQGFIIAARQGAGAYVFDLDGAERARYEGEDSYIALVGAGYAVVNADFLQLYDADGRLSLEAPPDSVVLEGVDGQTIISDGMWGEECVYLSGTSRRYQNLYPLGRIGGEAVYAYMTANVGRYMNDLLGEIQLSTDMDSARYGLVNGEGEVLLESQYLSIDFIGEDRLLARTEDAWQMMDPQGRIYWSYASPMQTEAPSF